MTAADRIGDLYHDGADHYVWTLPERTYRFMLDDGRTVDVTARTADDSDLRSALLAATKAERIVGSVRLPDQGTLT